MNHASFATCARHNGTYLSVTVPKRFVGQRMRASYHAGIVLINLTESEKCPVVIASNKISNGGGAFIRFGTKWVMGCPKFKTKQEVNFDGEKFAIHLFQQPLVFDYSDTKHNFATANHSITFLNKFAEENGYEFEIRAGKLSLVRTERIG